MNGLIFNIAQGLRDVEGIRVESLDKILGQVRKTVERLTETDPANPRLMRDKAVMLDEFAKTYLSAGNLTAAQRSAEESNAILHRLAELPERPTRILEHNVAVSLSRMGDVKRAQGDGPGHSPPTGPALPTTASGQRPTRPTPWPSRTSRIDLDRIADIKLYGGDSAGALKAYQEKFSPSVARWPRPSHNTERQRARVGQSRQDLRREARRGRRPRAALDACEEELDTARRHLAASDPGKTELQRDIAIGLERLGGLKLDAGDFAAALAAYEEGLVFAAAWPRSMKATRCGSATWRSGSAKSPT